MSGELGASLARHTQAISPEGCRRGVLLNGMPDSSSRTICDHILASVRGKPDSGFRMFQGRTLVGRSGVKAVRRLRFRISPMSCWRIPALFASWPSPGWSREGLMFDTDHMMNNSS